MSAATVYFTQCSMLKLLIVGMARIFFVKDPLSTKSNCGYEGSNPSLCIKSQQYAIFFLQWLGRWCNGQTLPLSTKSNCGDESMKVRILLCAFGQNRRCFSTGPLRFACALASCVLFFDPRTPGSRTKSKFKPRRIQSSCIIICRCL